MLSLRWKLGGALLLVALVSVGIMAYLIDQHTENQFQQYLIGGQSAYAQRVVDNLEQYYQQKNSWNGVQEILTASQRTSSDRLILADNSGKVIADTSGQLIGKDAAGAGINSSIPVQISGQTVGNLYLNLSSMGSGKGYMGGRGNNSANSSVPAVQSSEDTFLSQVYSYLWIAGIIAIAIALVVGVLMTRQIIHPLRSLNKGAQSISEGDLRYRVKVESHDELGKLAESFNNMANKLDSSEQSRKRLISDVAHELRTPLTIIQGTVDGMQDGVFPADQEHLDSIREQTVLLTHLVNDLRDLSLAESGQLTLQRVSTDIVDLVRRKLVQFEINARQKNISLGTASQGVIPEIIVDPRRIEQVIGNLLSNAIRHTPENGNISVSLKAEKSTAGKNQLVILVTDTGEGISPEHLPHIFERFYRVETSRSRRDGGAGLGLAIVKQMVEAHGGQVRVESQPGKGSTFWVSLPYAQ
jgi:signal transduction histidine kinase